MANQPKRLRIIDVLRVFAALWILLFHLSWQIKLFFGTSLFGSFISFGYLGVDLFFVLSGFLMAWHHAAIKNRRDYVAFLRGRLMRIYPLHLFILLCLAMVIYLPPHLSFTINNPTDYSFNQFMAQLFLVSAWDFPARMSWNYFAWAISALWLMYIFTPVFLVVFSRLPKTALVLSIVVLCGLTPVVMMISSHSSFVAYAVPRAIAGFGIGMALCFLLKNNVSTADFSQSKVLHYTADITYALYMTQYPVLMFFKKAFPTQSFIQSHSITQGAYLLSQIALCLIAALAMHHMIEKPANRLLSKAR